MVLERLSSKLQQFIRHALRMFEFRMFVSRGVAVTVDGPLISIVSRHLRLSDKESKMEETPTRFNIPTHNLEV